MAVTYFDYDFKDVKMPEGLERDTSLINKDINS